MNRLLTPTAALLIFLGTVCVWAETVWQDDFRELQRYERRGARTWTIADGQCSFRGDSRDSWLVALTPTLTEATVNAEMTLEQRTGSSYSTAGIALFADPVNHWRLLLVESPDGKRYCELVEMFNGIHQAQSGVQSHRMRLVGEDTGALRSWEYGKRYRLTLSISPQELTGVITDTDTNEFWQRTYSFARGAAVRRGRPALVINSKLGAFHSLEADAIPPPPGEVLALKPAARTAAVLRDQNNTVAPALAEALEKKQYGVTLIDWEQIGKVTLPWDRLDLFILADARRVPVGARDALVSALHSGGKVMAIGAPALSELLVETPEGWRGQAEWTRSYARRLKRTPIVIAPDAWRRAAMDLHRSATIEAEPAEGEDCWKVISDLKGWDTFRADIAGAFDGDRGLLVFEAKGDADTPQLSVECVEEDHSRWIAAVDLSPEWQTYVLRPADFPYWKDSDAEGRGAAGDRLLPENVVAIAIGLAGSHTPKVKEGLRTYWFRGLSTASGADVPDPDFSVPDIEALCPSYKLYPMNEIAHLQLSSPPPGSPGFAWTHAAYSPVWRERGRGSDRGRSWRWLPFLDAYDDKKRKRGSFISLMIGDGSFPNAVWANVGVADPEDALKDGLLDAVVAAAEKMTQGCFLLEGGAELFSYLPGETITLGARAANMSHSERELTIEVQVLDSEEGGGMFRRAEQVTVAPGRTAEVSWRWKPRNFAAEGYWTAAALREPGELVDTIIHRIEALRHEPAGPDEFVRVEGSNFMLGEEKWFFKGINYRPTWVGGYPHLNLVARECYDPEIVERDLTWMESIGINALSAVHALRPPDPDAPNAYRDQLDFLNRCDRHGMKCFFIVPNGRPYQGADIEKIKDYITRAGIKDHPAIMCWELAWEPIENPWQGRMDMMIDDWNKWIVERYGSIESATRDWAFDPERAAGDKLPIPTAGMCREHGDWDRYVAAFRRAFSDIISAKYRDIAEPLRAWDPKHLVSFRGGACGIPSRERFAHHHSVGVAKHMDFLNPEGYNLRTKPWGTANPPDDIRRGGLVTLYYRFISREKPVVWMEFGYTVNGFHHFWSPQSVHVDPEQLDRQKTEYENFYAMILESGARGAAPWWLPGGFRLGENSDFGILEPDGAERPACEVLRRSHPLFDKVEHRAPTRIIQTDFDTHYPDAWETYSAQYLEAVKAGEVPYLATAGTGTDSTTCPLTAVGGVEYNGHNPPQFLNAEFNRLELKVGEGPWRPILGGETIEVPKGARVLCRASVGNIGEAKWLAVGRGLVPRRDMRDGKGRVFLAGRKNYGLEFHAPIAADTPFLGDAEVKPFTLINNVGPTILPALSNVEGSGPATVSFEITSAGRAYFGERRTVTITPKAP